MSDSEQAVRGPGEVALLEVVPGVAVVVGEKLPEGGQIGLEGADESEAFSLGEVSRFGLGERTDRDIANALGNAVSGANVLAQGAQSLVAVHGLVRLAPETIKNLSTMQTMVKDGYNLGVLTHGGKVAAHVRWVPATSAQAAAVLSGLGPSVALLTISAQLTSISRKVDKNIDLTHKVLRALYEDHWDKLSGLYGTIAKVIEEAQDVGSVTSSNFDRIRARETDIASEYKTFSRYVDDHLKALDVDYAEKRRYLAENAGRILADVQGLIMVETAYFRYHMLRAAELAARERRDVEEDKTLERLAEQVPDQWDRALQRVAEILQQLDAQCHLAAETTGRGWSPRDFFSRNSGDIDEVVRSTITHVVNLRGSLYDEPLVLRPDIDLINEKHRSKVLAVLRWALPLEDPLLALAEVRQGRTPGATSYLGVTHDQFFLASSSDLMKDGKIDHFYSLSDIRYVRYRSPSKKGATLDIVTKDKDISVTLAAEDPWDDAGRRLADLLMSSANLPEEERRSVPPELEGIVSRRQLFPGGEAPASASRWGSGRARARPASSRSSTVTRGGVSTQVGSRDGLRSVGGGPVGARRGLGGNPASGH